MLVPKTSALLINARIVNINQVLSIQQQQLLTGTFAHFLQELSNCEWQRMLMFGGLKEKTCA
jgi:hypothetical protein